MGFDILGRCGCWRRLAGLGCLHQLVLLLHCWASSWFPFGLQGKFQSRGKTSETVAELGFNIKYKFKIYIIRDMSF